MILKGVVTRTSVGLAMAMVSGVCGMAQGHAESAKVPKPQAALFYVAANGNDAWSGKLAEPTPDRTDGPFRTMEHARDAAREGHAFGSTDGINVLIRGGVYTLTKTFTLVAQDSGTRNAPTVYQAFPGEKVILAGGPTVRPDAFSPITDVNVLERIAPEARAHVLQADLRAIGITDLGNFPVKYRGAPAAPELFFNGKRMTLARWPNEGWTTIASIVDAGSASTGTRGGVFQYVGDGPSRWNVDAGVWLHGYWCYDWHDEVIQVKSIDPEKRRITLAAPSVYSVKQGNPSPRRYYALNLIEELDCPGEYFIDRGSGLLYFWPPAPLADARVVLSTLKASVVAVKDATELILRGFTVEASLGSGFDVSAGNGVRIQACEIRNTRELGIKISGGTGHQIEACDIHDTGTGGIVLSGGDRKSLTPGRHDAVNNHIWRFSVHKLTYSNALSIEGVGNRAAHNLIHDAPHQAIGIVGNNHIIEYNIIHDVCMESDDCGALYKGRNPSCRGNIIRYNFWYHIGRPMGHGNAAVYFDDGDGGDTVFGNVFYRCGEPGKGSFGSVFSNGGHDNLAENNIFIECKRALGSSPWNDERWRAAVQGNGKESWDWGNKLLKEVDINRPPYTTRYPELEGFMDPKPGQARINRAVRNVFVMCGDVSNGNWQVRPENNWFTDRDPGFVNPTKGDFQLLPSSEVFSRLPAFQAIPFEKIGLIRNALRPELPMESRLYDLQKP